MSQSPLDKRLEPVIESYGEGRLLDVLRDLRRFGGDDPATAAQIDALESRYFFMLRYVASSDDSSSTVKDRDELKKALVGLMARVENRLAAYGNDQRGVYLRFQNRRPEETLASLCSDYLAELQKLHTDVLLLTDTSRRKTIEQLSDDIFMHLWADNTLTEDDFALVESLISDTTVPSYDRTLWTVALGMGYRSFSPDIRLNVLLAAHALPDTDVSAMAALWLVLAMPGMELSKRLGFAEVMERQHPGDIHDTLCVLAQSIATVAPKALSQAEMSRMSDISRRLNDSLRSKPDDADPAEYLSSILSAEERDLVQRFTAMQLQGDDMFSQSLGMMRHDAFYGRLSNWFLPYHPDHSSLASVVDGEGMALADTLQKVPGLCDSDKYALMLSIARMPDGLRAPALRQMTDQLYAMQQNEDFSEAIESASSMPRRLSIGRDARNLKRFASRYSNAAELWAGMPSEDELVPLVLTLCGNRAQEFAGLFAKSGLRYAAMLLFDNVLSHDDNPDLLIAAARNARDFGRPQKAAELYRLALGKVPGELSVLVPLAEILSDEGSADELLELLSPYASDMAENRSLQALWARANLETGHWDEAIEAFQSLPDRTEDERRMLGRAMLMTGDIYGAAEQFASLGAPADIDDAFWRAAASWFGGNKREALELLDSMTTADSLPELRQCIHSFMSLQGGSTIAVDNPVAFNELQLVPDMLGFKKEKGNGSLPLEIF